MHQNHKHRNTLELLEMLVNEFYRQRVRVVNLSFSFYLIVHARFSGCSGAYGVFPGSRVPVFLILQLAVR